MMGTKATSDGNGIEQRSVVVDMLSCYPKSYDKYRLEILVLDLVCLLGFDDGPRVRIYKLYKPHKLHRKEKFDVHRFAAEAKTIK